MLQLAEIMLIQVSFMIFSPNMIIDYPINVMFDKKYRGVLPRILIKRCHTRFYYKKKKTQRVYQMKNTVPVTELIWIKISLLTTIYYNNSRVRSLVS